MLTQSNMSLFHLMAKNAIIPVVENRIQFTQMMEHTRSCAVLLRHCNVFDFTPLLEGARRRGYAVYVNVDQVAGIAADASGLQFIAERLHIKGIVSIHAKTLSSGKQYGLETIQRIFAVDSTGLETSVAAVDISSVDFLEISPALVIPYIAADLARLLPLPFIGSGLVSTHEQAQAILKAGASGIAVSRPELWS